MTRCADCPYCGKAAGEACAACGGVNAVVWANKKLRARCEAERAGAWSVPPRSVTETTAQGKPAPRGDLCAGEE